MKMLLFLALLSPAAFGFELSRDTLESKLDGGDSVWLINRSPQTVRIPKLYVKRLSGRVGDGLIFKASNAPIQISTFSHWYHFQAIGDSLYVPTGTSNQNPDITIPPRDSIHIKNIVYGSCHFCLSMVAPYNYSIEVNFVESGRAPVKLIVLGDFVSGAIRSSAATPRMYRQSGASFRIDGRKLQAGANHHSAPPNTSRTPSVIPPR